MSDGMDEVRILESGVLKAPREDAGRRLATQLTEVEIIVRMLAGR